MRIRKVNGILYNLVNFWRSKGLMLRMKKSFYFVTIIVNILLLQGCKSPMIRKENTNA
jgi:hypothetical protein